MNIKISKKLYDIVRRSDPYSWHIMAPMYHSVIVIQGCPHRNRLVVDIQDPALFLAAKQEDETVQLEQAVLSFADHIVHKLPEYAWRILRDTYALKCMGTMIQSYPHSRFVYPRSRKERRRPPHVVFAGGMVPYQIAVSRGHENHVMDGVIHLSGADSFELSFFINQNARKMPWHEHQRYFDFEKEYPYFHLVKGLPYAELPRNLAQFDAGIFYDNVAGSSYNPAHYKYSFASKLFSYLEAGLPVVIYEELEAMAAMVKKYHLGTIYRVMESHSIIDAIHEASENDYAAAIKAFCQQFSMESLTDTLMAIHNL